MVENHHSILLFIIYQKSFWNLKENECCVTIDGFGVNKPFYMVACWAIELINAYYIHFTGLVIFFLYYG